MFDYSHAKGSYGEPPIDTQKTKKIKKGEKIQRIRMAVVVGLKRPGCHGRV